MVHGGGAPDWAAEGWEELAHGVGRCRLPGWDCTAGLVVGAAGVLLVDAGSTLGEGAALRGAVGRLLGGGRVTHLALTHPHFDHVLGTGAFADAEVIAAPGAARELAGAAGRAALCADAVDHGVAREDAVAATAALRAPGVEVSRPYELDLGGGTVALLVDAGPGHTAGDLAVLVRTRTGPPVLFCGDLVEESGPPQAGPDAQPGRWPDALDGLLALGGEAARYVPGHGAVVDAAFVRAQRAALAAAFGTGSA